MTTKARSKTARAALTAPGLLVLCALACLPWTQAAEARGGAGGPPAGAPNAALGGQLFDQCVQWVAQGGVGITRTTDFEIGVLAELDLDSARHQGPMRLWWKSPDKYRQALTTQARTTVKILNGEFLWIVHPNGDVQRMHGTAEGGRAITQLKEDRARMSDLAQFITLQSLRGPNATFEFAGEKSGSGAFAGEWLKLTRTAQGSATMHFWLAYDRASDGSYRAKWPGIIRVDGDEAQRIPTEDYVLSGWIDSPPGQTPAFRYPREVEAFSRQGGAGASRFLKATIQDIRINRGLDDALFRPPQGSGR